MIAARPSRGQLVELTVDALLVVLEIGLEATQGVDVLVALALDVAARVLGTLVVRVHVLGEGVLARARGREVRLGARAVRVSGGRGTPDALVARRGGAGPCASTRLVPAVGPCVRRRAHCSSTISASTISSSPLDEPSSLGADCDPDCAEASAWDAAS